MGEHRAFPWRRLGIGLILLALGLTGGFYYLSRTFMETAEPDVDFVVRPQLMTCAHKVYSNPDAGVWLAKTKFKNDGKQPIHDLKISYRMPSFQRDWLSESEYDVVLPGQTVVDYYYPTFPDALTSQTTKSTTEVDMKCAYVAASGRPAETTKSATFETLGKNEIAWGTFKDTEVTNWYDLFNNNWVVAAFVTPNEPALKKCAVHATRGTPSVLSDEAAATAVMQCFNYMKASGIAYITEPSSYWVGGSAVSQYVQFPRDTFERHGGTCIDLSVCLASMCEAVGLKTYIFLLPGHAIPIVEMPQSGEMVPIESTMVADASPAQAYQSAMQTVNKQIQEGTFIVVNPREWWKAGVVPPW
jgi:hypothetical protein